MEVMVCEDCGLWCSMLEFKVEGQVLGRYRRKVCYCALLWSHTRSESSLTIYIELQCRDTHVLETMTFFPHIVEWRSETVLVL